MNDKAYDLAQERARMEARHRRHLRAAPQAPEVGRLLQGYEADVLTPRLAFNALDPDRGGGYVSFTRRDGPAVVTINRDLSPALARKVEDMLRDLIDEEDAIRESAMAQQRFAGFDYAEGAAHLVQHATGCAALSNDGLLCDCGAAVAAFAQQEKGDGAQS